MQNNIRRFVKDRNLSLSTFGQFGGAYNRNLFTASQNICYLLVCISLVFLDNGLILAFEYHYGQVEKHTQFIAHNFLWVAYIEFFFGLYVPLKHIIHSRECLPELWWESTTEESSQFYVRKYSIHPRRYSTMSLSKTSDPRNFRSFSNKVSKNDKSKTFFQNEKSKAKTVKYDSKRRNSLSGKLKKKYRIKVLPKIQEEETQF